MWKFCITFAPILEIVSWCTEIAYHKSGLILAILSFTMAVVENSDDPHA